MLSGIYLEIRFPSCRLAEEFSNFLRLEVLSPRLVMRDEKYYAAFFTGRAAAKVTAWLSREGVWCENSGEQSIA